MPRDCGVAVLGGTFDRFHVGHADLIDAAFEAAGQVGVGVTTREYLRAHPKPLGAKLQSYRTRRAGVVGYVSRRFPRRRWWVVPLQDGWGRSVEPGVDVLVVSEETASGGREVNRERDRRGLPKLRVVTVPYRLGDDLVPVSSRAIRSNRVMRSGHHIGPVVVRLVALPKEWTAPVRQAFSMALAPIPVQVRRWESAPRAQPARGPASWDYFVERGGNGRSAILWLKDRSGNAVRLRIAKPSPGTVRAVLARALRQRRKVFSSQARSQGRWRPTSG